MYRSIYLLGLMAMSVLILNGCATKKKERTLQGRVTLNGKEITEGNVTFLSDSLGAGMTCSILPDGTYLQTGEIPAGEYIVAVGGLQAAPGEPPPKPTLIPSKYWSPQTSELSYKIVDGVNNFSIEMRTPEKKSVSN